MHVHTACTTSATAGVLYRGWSTPAVLKNRLSRAIAQYTRAPDKMSPLLHPNVEIMTATAMMLSPAPPNIAWRAAVPMGGWFSVEAIWMATRGSTFRYATLASRYRVVTTSTPTAMANGMSRSGCFSSPEAKPTLFQASIENSDPTIAAPMAVAPTATPLVAQKLAPKLAATAAAFLPLVRASRVRAA